MAKFIGNRETIVLLNDKIEENKTKLEYLELLKNLTIERGD